MIIAWENKFPAASLVASTEVITLPVQDVQVMPIGKPWRGIATSIYVDFDFGASVSLQHFAALGTNLTSAATHRIRLSNTDYTTGDVLDTGTVSAGVLENYPQVYYSHGSQLSARYGRWEFTDNSLSWIDIGYIFAGPGWEPTYGMDYGWSMGFQDASDRRRSLGGQLLMNSKAKYRTYAFTLSWNSESEMMDQGLALDEAVGLTENVLVRLDPTNYPVKQSVFGPMSQLSELDFHNYDAVRKTYRIEERL